MKRALLCLLLLACDAPPSPTPRPPACLFDDASVPAPTKHSTNPAVFTAEECHLAESDCVWTCSHDGLHILTQRRDCTRSDPARPFMRVTNDGGLEVIGR